MSYLCCSAPLMVQIASSRFVDLLLNSDKNYLNIFTESGITIDGVNVSTYNVIKDKRLCKVLHTLKSSSSNKVYEITSEPALDRAKSKFNAESLLELYKRMAITMYVFSNSLNNKVMPTMLVADNTGRAYFLCIPLSYQVHLPIKEGLAVSPNKMTLVPLSNTVYNDVLKLCDDNPMAKLYGDIEKFKVYNLNPDSEKGFEFRRYFEKVCKEFGFGDVVSILDKFNMVPITYVDMKVQGEFNCTKALVYSEGKIILKDLPLNINDEIVVLYESNSGDRRLVSNDLSSLLQIGGEMFDVSESIADLSASGESVQNVVKIKKSENDIDKFANMVIRDEPYDFSTFGETFNEGVEIIKNNVTKEGKKKELIHLITYTTDNFIVNELAYSGEGFEKFCLYHDKLKSFCESAGISDEYKQHLQHRLKVALKKEKERKYYENIVYIDKMSKLIGG